MSINAIFKDKFAIIGIRYYRAKRGSYTISKNFVTDYPNSFTFIEQQKIKNILEEKDKYKGFIFAFQRGDQYSFDFKLLDILELNHRVYTRIPLHAQIFNSCMNGFSVYRDKKYFKHFLPMITDFPLAHKVKQPNDITIGFYARPMLTVDAIKYFKNELKQLPYSINLVTMGQSIKSFTFPNINKYYHTNNNVDFFSRITHYYFPQSAIFMDPFPNTMLEAIQLGKQIICPRIKGRKHKDGIDDILSCGIKYHKKLKDAYSDIWYDNSYQGLVKENFKNFYSKVINNDFTNPLEPDKYKTFYDWCCHEL